MKAAATLTARPAAVTRRGGRTPVTRPPAPFPRGNAELSIRRNNFSKERKVSLLSVELSRERIRDRERQMEELHAIARVRAIRRARRDARARALRVRRILLIR